MLDFKAKMHQILFPLGLCPSDPAGRAYSTPPDSLAAFKGPTYNGEKGKRLWGEGE